MTTEIAVMNTKAESIEKVLIGGDLSKFSPEQRVSYYKQLCDSLGLNPLTQPFEYLTLNGKLRLYAKKDCTDQLRKIHGVSVYDLTTQKVEDVHIVVVHVRDKQGREDIGTGAVTVGAIKGDALANALMKAETKAKRRATLSICGLGLMDETELETIPAIVKEQAAITKTIEAEKNLLCEDCLAEVDAITVEGKFYTLEQVRANSQKHWQANLCGNCQKERLQTAKTQGSTHNRAETPVEGNTAPNVPDPYFAEIDGKLLCSGTVTTVSSPTKSGKGVKVSLKLLDGSYISTWHATMFEHIAKAKDKRCIFEYSVNGLFKNIEVIRKIGDQEFDGGVPVIQAQQDLYANESDLK